MPKAKLPDKDFKWSPELAYVIGLITTDGSLSSDGRHIIMRSSDIQLLKTFKECLSLPNKVKETFNNGWTKRPTYRIQFGNVQLYRWLLKIGLTPRKTYSIGKLKIPNKYFPDFLRGHLDGDGTVVGYIDRYNTYKNPKYIYSRIWLSFISASETHITWLQKEIFKLTGISGHLWKTRKLRPQRVPMWQLKFGKKDSLVLLGWMYYNQNVPCLHRKRKKIKRLLSIEYRNSLKIPIKQKVGRHRVLCNLNLINI
jgi:hypothetical protein